ncbi:STAS domain-containing protein [Streptomyces sp. NPDC001904]|uniref:STAS domain-containing protein n=1 Tax=Streptomyces sp. NPDC001904 TaxID=3154531 RepID=UPI00332A6DE5
MNITVERHSNSATLTPHGDIDLAGIDELHTLIAQLPPAVTEVVWDLRAVPFMDITGLHLLGAQAAPAHVSVTNLPPQPLRLLRLACELFPQMGWERHLPDSPVSRAA